MSDQAVLFPKWFFQGGTILAKGQLYHSYTFWTMPIMIFSPVYFFSGHTLHKLFCQNSRFSFVVCWVIWCILLAFTSNTGQYQNFEFLPHLEWLHCLLNFPVKSKLCWISLITHVKLLWQYSHEASSMCDYSQTTRCAGQDQSSPNLIFL